MNSLPYRPPISFYDFTEPDVKSMSQDAIARELVRLERDVTFLAREVTGLTEQAIVQAYRGK